MKGILLAVIKLYQRASFLHTGILKIMFLTDAVCRYHPTCSDYTYTAIEKYGALKGAWIGLKRIIRCHPWAKGGIDPLR